MHGEPAELRLLVPASSAWLTAALSVSCSAVVGLVAAGLLAPVGAGAIWMSRVRDRVGLRVFGVALVCAAGAASAAGWRVAAVHRGPLPALARVHTAVTLVVVVTSDPHLSASSVRRAATAGASLFAQRPIVVVNARATRVTGAGVTASIRSPIVILATSLDWLSLQPSQQVTAIGRLAAPQPGELVAAIFDARGPPTQVGSASTVQRAAGHLRAGLRAAAAPLSPGPRGLLPGLVDGDTSQLSPGLADAFRTTGLTHIVAVSGANVAIVLGAVLVLARWCRAGLRTQAWVGAVAIVAFVIVARPQASVLRAAAMGLVAVLALATGRRRRALPALCAAALCLVFIDPALAMSAGFALSVVATASLLVVAPPLRRRMARRLPGWLADALAVPTAATLACAPLIAAISGRVSLSSIPANLLAEPAVAPATILGVITACIAPLSTAAAQVVARAAGVPCSWLVFVARSFAGVPGSAVTWPDGWRGAAALVFVAFVLVLAAVVYRRRRVVLSTRAPTLALAMAGVVAVAGVVAARVSAVRWPPADWQVVVCDVGIGVAVVVRTAPQAGLLVDAGPSPAAIDRCLVELDVRELSVIVLSNAAPPVIGGLPGAMHGRVVGGVNTGSRFVDDGAARIQGWTTAAHVALSIGAPGRPASVGSVSWSVGPEVAAAREVRLSLPGVTAVIGGTDSGKSNAAQQPTVVVNGQLVAAENRGGHGDVALSVAGSRVRASTRQGSHLLRPPAPESAQPCNGGAPTSSGVACCPSCPAPPPASSPRSSATMSFSSNARSPPSSHMPERSTPIPTFASWRRPSSRPASWLN
jgi:competence protein ComEC